MFGIIKRKSLRYKASSRNRVLPSQKSFSVSIEWQTPAMPTIESLDVSAAILKRNVELTPTIQEKAALANWLLKVQYVLENLITTPGDFTHCKLEAICAVGSFKMGTMLRGHNTADLVVILKHPPTVVACKALAARLQQEMAYIIATEIVEGSTLVAVECNERGFDVFNGTVRVCVLLATSSSVKLKSESHLDPLLMRRHLIAIKHSRWFESNAQSTTIKVLIRILRDLVRRVDGLKMLNPRIIDLLAHYAVHQSNPSRAALSIQNALLHVFQLLAAGIFLPGSPGIRDPCDMFGSDIASKLTPTERDVCCMTAQTILRILLHGGYKRILGSAETIETGGHWDGVDVLPSEKVSTC